MKDKIIIFIIGVLVGAVLATGAFLIYTKVNSNNIEQIEQHGPMPDMNGGKPPEMPDGGEPPEKPDGENKQSTEKPSNNKKKKSETEENS